MGWFGGSRSRCRVVGLSLPPTTTRGPCRGFDQRLTASSPFVPYVPNSTPSSWPLSCGPTCASSPPWGPAWIGDIEPFALMSRLVRQSGTLRSMCQNLRVGERHWAGLVRRRYFGARTHVRVACARFRTARFARSAGVVSAEVDHRRDRRHPHRLRRRRRVLAPSEPDCLPEGRDDDRFRHRDRGGRV